ncbi:MAG: anion transporter [Caldilineaceae bacterium]
MHPTFFNPYWPALCLIALTIIGVAVGRYPLLRMNRATIALAGATGLVLLGAITLDDAYQALDLNTLTLLFAMMILNAYLRRAGFFSWWRSRRSVGPDPTAVARPDHRSVRCAVGHLLNDTVVLVFTPLLLEICTLTRLPPRPFLMAVATAANIGSVAMITGNPQNMLIGMASGISYIDFLWTLAPVAGVGMVVAWTTILLIYRVDLATPFVQPPALLSTVDLPVLRKSLLATTLLLSALLAGMAPPLATLMAAVLLLITRRTAPEAVFHDVDWSLLVFFSGLFVVTGTLEQLGVSTQLFQIVQPFAARGVAAFSLVAALLSNLISNVPAVLLFAPFVPQLPNSTQSWLTLAMATTLAGNLTLLGSVANLIVAESARQRGVHFSFNEYLKAGLPITIVSLLFGIFWLQ